MNKKVLLVNYLRDLGFRVTHKTKMVFCKDKHNIVTFKRGALTEQHFRGIKTQLEGQGYNVDDFDELFLTKRKREFPVVTLCGSTKFKKEYLEIQKQLTLEGNIVISVGLFGHSGNGEVWTDNTKEMLDKMHLRKIDMADEVFIINKGGYIGESTRKEISYALKKGKTVKFLEPDKENLGKI